MSDEFPRIDLRVQALFDSIGDPLLGVDRGGVIRRANVAANTQFGAVIDTPVAELFEPETGRALADLCRSGFVGVGESDLRLVDGRLMSFSVLQLDGEHSHVVFRDVSLRQRLEDELLHARRMASVGRLAAEVAHEINNPLAVIQGRIEMLRAMPEMDKSARERHLSILEEHCLRVARIVQNLHTFARPRTPDKEWVDLHACVADALKRAGRRLDRVEVEVDLPEGARIWADLEQSALVADNLLNTALDLLGPERQMRMTGRNEEDGSADLQLNCPGGSWPDEILANLRSPYSGASTSIEPGWGLSLAIAWGIIQDHGGWMTAANEADKGAVIEWSVPGPVRKDVSPELGPQTGVNTLSILVVDDDPVQCETVAWMLSTQGHRATVVHSAEDALNHLESGQFDLLMTDHRLPGMDGETLIEKTLEQWPAYQGRTLLTSGLLHRPKEGRRYLQKPFSRQQLLDLIRELS